MHIYTIGHSTHEKETFLQMLADVSIQRLIDVRAFPGSRKFPQFGRDHMPVWLKEAGIDYHHMEKLGGRRRKSDKIADNVNAGWNNSSFHNYADYTLTKDFTEGIKQLGQFAAEKKTAYFCSERHPARCHRLLISNWLAANGWKVRHILPQKEETEVVDHQLGKWGAMPIIEADGTVVYPEITNHEE